MKEPHMTIKPDHVVYGTSVVHTSHAINNPQSRRQDFILLEHQTGYT
jgi:hypothetical protein